MDVTCSPQSFSCLSRLLQFSLIFLLIVTQLQGLEETKELPPLSGEIGGEVTFHCPFSKKIIHVYLQKGDEFVNGYHAHLIIPTPKWENTRLDSDFRVHMNQLNISHAGVYTCHIQYADMTFAEVDVQLSVTANYTTPNVTISYHDHNCMVTCTSHGGYPKNKILWDVHALGNASSQMSKFVESRLQCDAQTHLCNISSTASFNCSDGLQKYISCYVDKTELSSTFSICESKPAAPDSPAVTIALILIPVSVAGALLMLMVWKILNRRTERIRNPTVEEGQSLREARMEKES